MVQGGLGYCRCGQEIWLEYLRRGDQWLCRFSAPEGGEITHCLGCGHLLDEDELESLTDPQR